MNGMVSIHIISTLSGQVKTLANDRMPKVESANDIIDNLNIIARALRNVVIDTSKETQEAEFKRIAEAREQIGKQIKFLQETAKSEKGKALVKKVFDARALYIEQYLKYIELVKNGQIDTAKGMLLTSIREVQKKYFAACEELIVYQESLQTDCQGGRIDGQILGNPHHCPLDRGLCMSGLMAFLIIRSITGPVNKTVELAETMAKGDLTTKLEVDQKDEIGGMAKSMNSTVAHLRSMISEIVGGINNLSTSSADLAAVSRQLSTSARDTADKSGTVAAAAEEMSTNIQSVSAAMEQSSSNVNMVASATEEMTATVNEIGQNAEKARSISEERS